MRVLLQVWEHLGPVFSQGFSSKDGLSTSKTPSLICFPASL